MAAGPTGFPGLWEGLQPCPRCMLTHSWMTHWLSELDVSVAHPLGGSLKSWAVDVGWSIPSGRCWELEISPNLLVPYGGGVHGESMSQPFMSFSMWVIFSLTMCGSHSGFLSMELFHVLAVYLVHLWELGLFIF